jgi:hypothetical protein
METARATHPISTLGQIFQLAYVTTDLAPTIEYFSFNYGVAQFKIIRGMEFRHDSGFMVRADLALAYAGNMMIECIQPLDRAFAFYSDRLPATGFAMQFHHLGMLLHTAQEFDQVGEALRLQGASVPYAGSFHGVSFLYVDTWAELGHYLEYIHLSGPARHFWDDVPVNSAGARATL